MKQAAYDCSALADRMGDIWNFDYVKKMMLEAIGNIAVAVRDKDAILALDIQSDLMWVYDVISSIREVEE